MEHNPQVWGQPKAYHLLRRSYPLPSMETTRTTQPIVTGTSVLAIKYTDGVVLAADTLASYGSLARFRNQPRIHALSQNTLLATSGDISDLQATLSFLHQKQLNERILEDGHELTPRQWHTLLATEMYARRSKLDPWWNAHVVAGFDRTAGQSFLGFVDLLGTTYEDDSIATGYGAYLAQPLLREQGALLSEADAIKLLEKCMKVLWYRDARSTDLIQIAKVTRDGMSISEPYRLESDWSIGYY